jgi:hypothetical protein
MCLRPKVLPVPDERQKGVLEAKINSRSDFRKVEVKFERAQHNTGLMLKCVVLSVFKSFDSLEDRPPDAHLFES